jgi:hypothetical protein
VLNRNNRRNHTRHQRHRTRTRNTHRHATTNHHPQKTVPTTRRRALLRESVRKSV